MTFTHFLPTEPAEIGFRSHQPDGTNVPEQTVNGGVKKITHNYGMDCSKQLTGSEGNILLLNAKY